ncbi:MAG: energy-coupling factor ABC transporter permease [Endomicrobium sp.]|jgi:cobalt/nickel transport system permease protein|nr:energy-coupling factor ABC transporter permease [Endomicrobium sp.]
MHIPDGFLNNSLTVGLLSGASVMFGCCLKRVHKIATAASSIASGSNGSTGVCTFEFFNGTNEYIQKLTIIAMWVFSSQMFNIPVQSKISAHLIGGVFTAVIVGPFAGFLVISSVLIVQSTFFSDGGILALGANIFNMAFIGSFISYYVYKAVARENYYLAILVSCLFSVLSAAFFCLIELSVSGIVHFSSSFKNMMCLHLIVALLETVITIVLLWLLKFICK